MFGWPAIHLSAKKGKKQATYGTGLNGNLFICSLYTAKTPLLCTCAPRSSRTNSLFLLCLLCQKMDKYDKYGIVERGEGRAGGTGWRRFEIAGGEPRGERPCWSAVGGRRPGRGGSQPIARGKAETWRKTQKPKDPIKTKANADGHGDNNTSRSRMRIGREKHIFTVVQISNVRGGGHLSEDDLGIYYTNLPRTIPPPGYKNFG